MPQTAVSAILKPQSDLLTNDEAAAYLGCKPRSLEVWRCTGRYRIEHLKIGRLVRYRKAALDAWLNSRTIGVE